MAVVVETAMGIRWMTVLEAEAVVAMPEVVEEAAVVQT